MGLVDDTAVDAVVRLRTSGSDPYMTDWVVQSSVSAGTHLFMAKVEVNYLGTTDRVSVWFDPTDISSEAAAGTPTGQMDALCWEGTSAAWLVFSANNIGGANSQVGYDEVRFASMWIPEPTSFVLVLSGSLALIFGAYVRLRRRRA